MGNQRIAVIGNCQSTIMTDCLSMMAPSIEVRCGFTQDLRSGAVDIKELLPWSDTLVVQDSMQTMVRKVMAEAGLEREVYTYPEIYFTGYHPDLVYAYYKGKTIKAGINFLNSAIALYCWSKGVSVDDTLSLFREDIYRHLGYFDHMEASRTALIQSAAACGMDMADIIDEWMRGGCFLHTPNHPRLHVMCHISRQVLAKIGVEPTMHYPENYVPDPLIMKAVWPIYPEIGKRYGIGGEYLWKLKHRGRDRIFSTMTLEEFVRASFANYDGINREEIVCDRFKSQAFQRLLPMVGRKRNAASNNPYSGLPPHHFWKSSVATPSMTAVDPVISTRFTIDRTTKVATAGSCFAQHIAKTLQNIGLHYYVPENGAGLPRSEIETRNYGVFSARYGNVYTARQLDQLIDRAYGRLSPDDTAWERHDGVLVDPFRPQIEPDGFADLETLLTSREEHFAYVRQMFETLNVFVFTLGLTEGWRSKADGAVFPLAPGVAGGKMNSERYEFVNFSADEIAADLDSFLGKLWAVNPNARIILTVSPVPLIATYENRHVLVSTIYSKSALRTAAETIIRKYSNTEYFPSYEIITGSYTRGAYFDDDLRTVNPEGVAHVMGIFTKHYVSGDSDTWAIAKPVHAYDADTSPRSDILNELAKGRSIVCEEEAIASDLI